MSRFKLAAGAAAIALCAACGPSHTLHVAVSHCVVDRSSGTPTLHAQVRNETDKPVGGIDVRADAYRNFRFVRITASPQFKPVLDPGVSRDIAETASEGGDFAGAISQCNATAVAYGDGTRDAMP